MTTAAGGVTSAGEASDGMIWEIHEKAPVIEGLDDSGRPDPAYASALGLLPAPLGRRALAAVCDAAIWMLLQLPLWFGAMPLVLKLTTGAISPYGLINHPGFVLAVVMAAATVVLTLVFSIVQWVLHGRKGFTIGKIIAGVRTVNVRTLERPKAWPMLLRFLIVSASNLVPLLGPLFFLMSPMFDPEGRGRGWHDKATGAWLVDTKGGLNPYDEKRMRVARKMMKAEPTPERTALPSLATPVDPAAQPEYRPGRRVSAGVLGVARPHEANEQRPAVAPPPEPVRAPEPVPAPVPAPQPAPAPAPRFGLRLDTGESIAVSEPVLLGRNPDAAEHPGARAIALADDSKSLSKTHLLARPVDGGLEIVDCRSTNGSGLIRDGVEYEVTAGVPVSTTEGDRIRFGDRVADVVRV